MDFFRYLKIVKDEEIARRYFVMNSFDGALAILGIVIAVYMSDEHQACLVIIPSIGAAIAMAISGIWGAYSIERAERRKSLKELEMHLLSGLEETEIQKKINITTVLVALVDGFSPLFVSLIIISPFFLTQAGLLPIDSAFISSVALVVVILFILGIFIGHVAREDGLRNGLKMVFAGLVVGLIVFLLKILGFLE